MTETRDHSRAAMERTLPVMRTGATHGTTARATVIDSHQHFWRYNASEYGWITSDKAVLKRDYLPDDLLPLLRENGVDGCIAVQARQTVAETEWLLELADRHDFIQGVVGWVDLCSPGLPGQLERLGRHPKLVGVRHVVHDEPDDAFMLRADFQRGIAQLAAYGLAYDLLIFARHLPAAIALVRLFPEQRFILDHIAKPDIRGGSVSPWDEGLRELARSGRVDCKLSGLVTEARWRDWQYSDYPRYLDCVVEAFGPERLMIGSDWPVCTLSSPYGQTLGVVGRYIEQFSPAIRERILGGNCARAYALEGNRS